MAFAETTQVLSSEYHSVGSSVYSVFNEARLVRASVVDGLPMKIGRVISDLFLWLAQVQTLIRLFPREREKAVIKWAGFGLILLDTTFSILQTFVSPGRTGFLDAVPALSYLFQISLSMLYASCVVYYSWEHRRLAWFYRPWIRRPWAGGQMTAETRRYGARSIILVAGLSVVAVWMPVVFFIVDIAQKDLAGWGDYIRWVGAAAASVVVWEWVDRVEGLEREERKGGVLGRVVWEEDEVGRYRGSAPDNPPSNPPPPVSSTGTTSSSSALPAHPPVGRLRPPSSGGNTSITTSSGPYAVRMRHLTPSNPPSNPPSSSHLPTGPRTSSTLSIRRAFSHQPTSPPSHGPSLPPATTRIRDEEEHSLSSPVRPDDRNPLDEIVISPTLVAAQNTPQRSFLQRQIGAVSGLIRGTVSRVINSGRIALGQKPGEPGEKPAVPPPPPQVEATSPPAAGMGGRTDTLPVIIVPAPRRARQVVKESTPPVEHHYLPSEDSDDIEQRVEMESSTSASDDEKDQPPHHDHLEHYPQHTTWHTGVDPGGGSGGGGWGDGYDYHNGHDEYWYPHYTEEQQRELDAVREEAEVVPLPESSLGTGTGTASSPTTTTAGEGSNIQGQPVNKGVREGGEGEGEGEGRDDDHGPYVHSRRFV